MNELLRLHKSIAKNDYKNAKLRSTRITFLCNALIPQQSHDNVEVKG